MVETIEGVSYTPNWEQRQEIVKILMNDYRSFMRTERGQKLMSRFQNLVSKVPPRTRPPRGPWPRWSSQAV